jgi:hypothetical protein
MLPLSTHFAARRGAKGWDKGFSGDFGKDKLTLSLQAQLQRRELYCALVSIGATGYNMVATLGLWYRGQSLLELKGEISDVTSGITPTDFLGDPVSDGKAALTGLPPWAVEEVPNDMIGNDPPVAVAAGGQIQFRFSRLGKLYIVTCAPFPALAYADELQLTLSGSGPDTANTGSVLEAYIACRSQRL